ncbi:TPA: winged helix-turn-helix domain-containing protein [Salmonella enterica subsp. enterica serovar Chester]
MRLLLIEEINVSGHPIGDALEKCGFNVDIFDTCEGGEAALRLIPYVAVILDVTCPGAKGLTVIQQWRKKGIKVPVLVLTGVGDVAGTTGMLNAGADDCMRKPVVIAELTARLGAIIRRCHEQATPILRHGEISMDTGSRVVKRDGITIKLTSREMSMLEIFLLNKKRILAREYLDSQFCAWRRDISSNVIEVHICSLRRKLGANFIQTIRGQGYRLCEVPTDREPQGVPPPRRRTH